jgi:hypothetical protein
MVFTEITFGQCWPVNQKTFSACGTLPIRCSCRGVPPMPTARSRQIPCRGPEAPCPSFRAVLNQFAAQHGYRVGISMHATCVAELMFIPAACQGAGFQLVVARMSSEEQVMQEHLKRQFICLVYGRDCFLHATNTTRDYLAIASPTKSVEYTYVSSAVITYCNPIVGSRTMGQLPSRYEKFPSTALGVTHRGFMRARNEIYAHTDREEVKRIVRIKVEQMDKAVRYSYGNSNKSVLGIVFNDVLALLTHQLKRIEEDIQQMMPKILPLKTARTLMRAERGNSTEIDVFWPKPKRK